MKKVLNSFFKKSDNFLTCGIGAYLMMILVDLLTSTSKDLFLTLSPISLLKLGVFFVSVPLLIFVPKKISSLSIHRINIIVSSLILLVAIFKSISFFLALGFIFLSLLLFTGAFLRNEKYSYLYLFVILLTTPRLLTLASINLQDTALGFHAINLAETRFNTILWPVLLAFFLSAIFLILFNNLPIEKYIERPRHIEFQILADSYGNVIHLGERDCSIQRRHQKVLEEAPSVFLDSKLREKMGKAAVSAAKAAGYENAGTIEFLVDKNKNFYFMEMNTRIQVEHPVTEMITGIDLIKEQIRVAAGEKLSLTQKDVKIEGHSIECRINAENPDKNFAPSPGRIESMHLPGGNGVRIDTHIYEDYTVSPFYDSMLLKLIVHGKTRQEAIAKMRSALGEIVIEGVDTNIDFNYEIINNPYFIDADIDTSFIEKQFKM